jgi:hypothetical protein
VPATVGLPEILPALFMVSPLGRVPLETLQV